MYTPSEIESACLPGSVWYLAIEAIVFVDVRRFFWYIIVDTFYVVIMTISYVEASGCIYATTAALLLTGMVL